MPRNLQNLNDCIGDLTTHYIRRGWTVTIWMLNGRARCSPGQAGSMTSPAP
jgi:hypothetical protein